MTKKNIPHMFFLFETLNFNEFHEFQVKLPKGL